jgi:tetratricopeptide (TPR) repeat protein
MTSSGATLRRPDGRTTTAKGGVLVEPASAGGRVVFWLQGDRGRGYQDWDRVGSVPHSAIAVGQGICTVAAVSVGARQRLGNPFLRLLRRLRRSRATRVWTLPDGNVVEQCGERRTDLILAWSEDETTPLEESRVARRWPESQEIRAVGHNLYLISIEPPNASGSGTESEPESLPQCMPRERAERALAAARARGDPSGIVLALTDMGLALVKVGDASRATSVLEEALSEARRIGARAQEADIMSALGLAFLHTRQAARARVLLEQALVINRFLGDPHAEKITLDRLAIAHGNLRDHVGSLVHVGRALALAAMLGDQHHEASLLWFAALQHAELSQRDQALSQAQAAVDLMARLVRPQVEWYAHHLAQYRSSNAGFAHPATGETGEVAPTTSFTTTVLATRPGSDASGPGFLRMALTATEAMATFLGSGLKTVNSETYRRRLEICSSCDHHTGLRCRICGCFTDAKARLPYEHCPLRNWPA